MSRKKERKGAKLNSGSPTTKVGIEEKEKDLYLIQIGFLNEELERFQIKCNELQKQNKILISQYSQLDADKKDITEYLKRSLSEKDEELGKLLEELEGERQAAVQEKQSLLRENSQLRQEFQARIDKLREKNAALAEKLADLDEFQRRRDDLMINMENLEKQLECLKKEHRDEIHSLEMKGLLEKSRLEKELESEVAVMSARVQHLVDQKLPETAGLVLLENKELKTQLSQLSDVARSLQRENAALREQRSQLSVDTDILEQLLRQTTRISCVRKKDVQQLTGRLQSLQDDIRGKQQQLEHLQTEHTQVLAEVEALRLDRSSLSAEWSRSRLERNQMEVKLKEERSRMKSIMQEAADTLRQALKVLNWRQLLQNLQDVLDREALSCSDPASPRPGSLNRAESWSFQFLPSRHESPDSCLVFRPSAKPRDSLRVTGAAACSSIASLHRKHMIQKSSSSVNFSRSAVGFPTSKQLFTKPSGQKLLQTNPKKTQRDFFIVEKYI